MQFETWIDLEAHGMEMMLVRVPGERIYYIIRDLSRDLAPGLGTSAFKTQLVQLGYRTPKENNGLYLREARFDTTQKPVSPPDPAEFKRHIPNSKVVTFDVQRHFIDQRGQQAQVQRQDDAEGRFVGQNSLGQNVYQRPAGGRYVTDGRGTNLDEVPGDAAQRGNFLRAEDPEGRLDTGALLKCAQALVDDARTGTVDRAALDGFAALVFRKKPDAAKTAALDAAVETALAVHVAKRGGRTLREGFTSGYKLAQRFTAIKPSSDGRLGLPIPLALSMQRLVGVTQPGDRIDVHGVGAGEILTHMDRGAVVRAFPETKQAAEAALTVAQATGLREYHVGGSQTSTDALSTIHNLFSKPKDVLSVRRALKARAADGVSVLLVREPKTEAETRALQELREEIATNYGFEGEAEIDPSLVSSSDGAGARLLVAGRRRAAPDPDAPLAKVTGISDWSNLWTWSSEVVSRRSRDVIEAKVPTGVAVTLNKGSVDKGNSYQAPYVSASKVGKPRTMVPRNLEGAMKDSLARIVNHAGGDVDAWVAREFQFSPEDLARLFSPEQVDAMATYLYAQGRGRGFIDADQMGVGKGRVLASIIRRNALLGIPSIFLSEKQVNLSDIWRDLMHIESDHLIKPMVLNDGVQIIDERSGQTLFRSSPREDVEAMLNSERWPDGVNLVMSTYSQFNRDISEPKGLAAASKPARTKTELDLTQRKVDWLHKAVDRNVRMVMDESHNAANPESNVSKNITKAIEQSDRGVVFASATLAPDADAMAFYARLFPDDISTAELASMMKKGGESFQEILAGMLVHDGVMVRREFDLSRITYSTIVDTPRFDRNRAYMDALAPVLFELTQLSSEVDALVRRQNDALRREQAGAEAPANRRGKQKPFHMTRTGFGSPLYTITRLFVAALKVDATVDDAIASLKANKKPVIVVDNTVQSLLEELAETEESSEGTLIADFRALFGRTVRQMTQARWKDEKGVSHRRDMSDSDAGLRERVDAIAAMVEALPILPVSSIDEVKRRIREAGFSCEEITGRTLEVTDGRVLRRAASNPTVVKNAFNSGDLDAVIINVAGSTGIDLHASTRFADRRPRRLIELQASADILRKIQSHGRVNRYDQVADPEIISIISGLPIEMRMQAMENAKLRRLSANTTSNREAATLTRDIPDLINEIGDIVCVRYAELRPELMRRLGFRIEDVQAISESNQDIEKKGEARLKAEIVGKTKTDAFGETGGRVQDGNRTANEILARLIMLPVSMQERICTEMTAEYNAAIEELEARGETPLRTHELAGVIHPHKRYVFEGAEVENPDSVFHEPLYSVEAALERTGKAYKSDDLLQRVEIGQMASGRARQCVDRLRSGIEEIVAPLLPDGVPTMAEAIEREKAQKKKTVTAFAERITGLADTLLKIQPGSEITYTLEGIKTTGIVTIVSYPERGYEHVPGIYGVEFVLPGDERPRTMRLETLMKDAAFTLGEGLQGVGADAILRKYDDAEKVNLSTVNILDHNIYRAMRVNVEHNLGTLKTYVTKDGTRHRGIVLSKAHRNLRAVPVEATDADIAWTLLVDNRAELIGSNGMQDKTFSVAGRRDDDMFEFRLPKRNSRLNYIYADPVLDGLLRRWEANGKGSQTPRITVTKTEAKDVVEALYTVGARFWCAPTNRDLVNKIHKERQQKLPARDDEPAVGMSMVA
jgi:hypothetical protein